MRIFFCVLCLKFGDFTNFTEIYKLSRERESTCIIHVLYYVVSWYKYKNCVFSKHETFFIKSKKQERPLIWKLHVLKFKTFFWIMKKSFFKRFFSFSPSHCKCIIWVKLWSTFCWYTFRSKRHFEFKGCIDTITSKKSFCNSHELCTKYIAISNNNNS